MKCPVCWSDKAYRRKVQTWTDALCECFLFLPFKCDHCFHKFYKHWLLTLGKQTRPPAPTDPPRRPTGMTQARKHMDAARASDERDGRRSCFSGEAG